LVPTGTPSIVTVTVTFEFGEKSPEILTRNWPSNKRTTLAEKGGCVDVVVVAAIVPISVAVFVLVGATFAVFSSGAVPVIF